MFEAGKRTAAPMLALHRLDDGMPPRLGLAVSRKVDPHAIGRNRIKRVLRDAMRHLRPEMAGGDFVVVARSAAKVAENPQIREAFERLLRRAGALPAVVADGTMPPREGNEPSSSLNAPGTLPGRAEPAC